MYFYSYVRRCMTLCYYLLDVLYAITTVPGTIAMVQGFGFSMKIRGFTIPHAKSDISNNRDEISSVPTMYLPSPIPDQYEVIAGAPPRPYRCSLADRPTSTPLSTWRGREAVAPRATEEGALDPVGIWPSHRWRWRELAEGVG
jgi:hypothetical protein